MSCWGSSISASVSLDCCSSFAWSCMESSFTSSCRPPPARSQQMHWPDNLLVHDNAVAQFMEQLVANLLYIFLQLLNISETLHLESMSCWFGLSSVQCPKCWKVFKVGHNTLYWRLHSRQATVFQCPEGSTQICASQKSGMLARNKHDCFPVSWWILSIPSLKGVFLNMKLLGLIHTGSLHQLLLGLSSK